jgi:hypothetical protein
MSHIARNGTSAYIGLPEREAMKLQDLWQRDEIGVELSVEVKAPVVVGIYPMRIARFVLDQATNGNGYHPPPSEPVLPEPASAPELGPEPLHQAQPVRSEPPHPQVTFEDAPEA